MSEHQSLVEQLCNCAPHGGAYVRVPVKLHLRLIELLKEGRIQEPKVERRTTKASRGKNVQTKKG